ncbi:MAG TPA: beta-ketoacyl synthase chain length factor, partial [Burkholderiales bacterium]|nr:beta-ketoacyl synthase chain length factor [Burkholderiales bacterium]
MRWAAWPPTGEGLPKAPDVSFVEPALRRRLGPLARMMLHVGQECARDVPEARLVFASRHGELQYTLLLLRSLAMDEALSPTVFSLAVHNAASGLFSILRRDRSASTALAAGGETLGHALLEASCQLATEAQIPVLVVYGDAPLPGEYARYRDGEDLDDGPGCALSVLLSAEAERRVSIDVRPAGHGGARDGGTQAASFIRFLAD